MTLEKILNISGKPGLHKLISQAKSHIIVESLEDGRRFPITNVTQINSLNNIAIYTYSEELALADVLYKIHKHTKGKEAVSPKANKDELMSFFEEVLPDYDKDRVYVSHVKKIVLWYNILTKSNFDLETLAPKNNED